MGKDTALVGGSHSSDVAPFRLGRRPALTGIRALAVLAVMAFHTGYPWAGSGYLGVDMFFVLSGFLITVLLLEERDRTGRLDLRHFYFRRAFRLLPALALLLVACSLYALKYPARPENHHFFGMAAAVALYVGNWALALQNHFTHPLLTHAWSLSVEEQFYLLWPVLLGVLIARKASRPTLFWVALGGAMASTLLRVGTVSATSMTPGVFNELYYGLFSRGGALLFGCALGIAVSSGFVPSGRSARRMFGTGALLAAAALVLLFVHGGVFSESVAHAPRMFVVAIPLVSVLSMALILGLVAAPESSAGRVFSTPGLVWIGAISYGLYLWDYPVSVVLYSERNLIHAPGSVMVVVGFALTFLLAGCSFYLVEKPLLQWSARWRTGAGVREPRRPLLPRVTGRPAWSMAAVAAVAVVAIAVAGMTITRRHQEGPANVTAASASRTAGGDNPSDAASGVSPPAATPPGASSGSPGAVAPEAGSPGKAASSPPAAPGPADQKGPSATAGDSPAVEAAASCTLALSDPHPSGGEKVTAMIRPGAVTVPDAPVQLTAELIGSPAAAKAAGMTNAAGAADVPLVVPPAARPGDQLRVTAVIGNSATDISSGNRSCQTVVPIS